MGGSVLDDETPVVSLCDTNISGRIAAELLWNVFGDGAEVAIFTAQKDTLPHASAIEGFVSMLDKYPLKLVNIFENYDDPDMAYHATDLLLRMYPSIKGVYVCSANSRLVCKRIHEAAQDARVRLVTSDLYDGLSEYIEHKIVCATIYQRQYEQGVQATLALCDQLMNASTDRAQKKIILEPTIIMQSNVHSLINSVNCQAKDPNWINDVQYI